MFVVLTPRRRIRSRIGFAVREDASLAVMPALVAGIHVCLAGML